MVQVITGVYGHGHGHPENVDIYSSLVSMDTYQFYASSGNAIKDTNIDSQNVIPGLKSDALSDGELVFIT